MNMKRIVVAVGAACALTLIPIAVMYLPFDSAFVARVKVAMSYLMAPGYVVGLLLSGRHVDDVLNIGAALMNFIFYLIVSYVVALLVGRVRTLKAG
jgi:hypothetical protein